MQFYGRFLEIDLAPFFLEIWAKVKNSLRLSHLYSEASLCTDNPANNLLLNCKSLSYTLLQMWSCFTSNCLNCQIILCFIQLVWSLHLNTTWCMKYNAVWCWPHGWIKTNWQVYRAVFSISLVRLSSKKLLQFCKKSLLINNKAWTVFQLHWLCKVWQMT